MAGARVGAQLSDGVEAVEPWHHDVDRHHVGRHAVNHVERVLPIDGGHDLKALADESPDHGAVVNDEHSRSRLAHG